MFGLPLLKNNGGVQIYLALFRQEDNSEFREKLKRKNIFISSFPLITYEPLDEYDWRICDQLLASFKLRQSINLLFTSSHAVKRFVEIINGKFLDSFKLNFHDFLKTMKNTCKTISVGPATSDCLEKYGFIVDYKNSKNNKESLLQKRGMLGQIGIGELIIENRLRPVVHLCAETINPYLENFLVSKGWDYQRFPIYRTNGLVLGREQKKKIMELDYLFFTSGSIVKSFFENFPNLKDRRSTYPPVILIGEQTKLVYTKYQKMRKIDMVLRGQSGDALSDRLIDTILSTKTNKSNG